MPNHQIHAVGVLIESRDGKLLAVHRNANEVEGNTWGPIGGEINIDEEIPDAGIREIFEETGLKVDKKDLKYLKTYDNAWQSDGTDIKFEVYSYKVAGPVPDIKLDGNEATEYIWQTPEKLYQRRDLLKGFYIILKDIYNL